jgi:hypothetical protein
MKDVVNYLYSYCSGECGPDYWRSWPILKITPMRIIIGGWHYEEHRLDRQKVEAGNCYRPERMYTEEQMRREDPEGKLEIVPLPHDRDMFSKAVPMTDGLFERLGRFVNAVQAVVNKCASALEVPTPQVVQYDDGPVWVRICLSRNELDNSVYCFVRKADGAAFVADSRKRPRTKTGAVGYLHDYAPDLLKGYGPCPQNGKRYLKERQP